MKILVLVKTVPDEEGAYVLNYDDKNMLEIALRWKEKEPGAVRVDLLCFGPENGKRALRGGLAAGADRAFLAAAESGQGDGRADAASAGPSGWDGPEYIADILCRAVEELSEDGKNGGRYDLFLCGFQSEDMRSGAVGIMLAERLGIPQITCVSEFLEKGGTVAARRELPDRVEWAEAQTPCLLCGIQQREQLRGVGFMEIQASFEKELSVWSLGELADREAAGLRGGPDEKNHAPHEAAAQLRSPQSLNPKGFQRHCRLLTWAAVSGERKRQITRPGDDEAVFYRAVISRLAQIR